MQLWVRRSAGLDEPYAQLRFERRDLLAHSRLRGAQLARDRRETAGLDHPDVGLPNGQSVNTHSNSGMTDMR